MLNKSRGGFGLEKHPPGKYLYSVLKKTGIHILMIISGFTKPRKIV